MWMWEDLFQSGKYPLPILALWQQQPCDLCLWEHLVLLLSNLCSMVS